MNLGEGTRRLAIAVGVIGCIAGVFASWCVFTGFGDRDTSVSPLDAGSYLLIAILPVLGFFLPWGAVRAFGWVIAGFVAGSK